MAMRGGRVNGHTSAVLLQPSTVDVKARAVSDLTKPVAGLALSIHRPYRVPTFVNIYGRVM